MPVPRLLEKRMTADDNIRLVQQQFEAFGRGDIDVALAAVADNVDWHAPVSAHASPLPWAGRRRGRQQVADYFHRLPSAVRPQPFQDLTFTASGATACPPHGHRRAGGTR